MPVTQKLGLHTALNACFLCVFFLILNFNDVTEREPTAMTLSTTDLLFKPSVYDRDTESCLKERVREESFVSTVGDVRVCIIAQHEVNRIILNCESHKDTLVEFKNNIT